MLDESFLLPPGFVPHSDVALTKILIGVVVYVLFIGWLSSQDFNRDASKWLKQNDLEEDHANKYLNALVMFEPISVVEQ